MTAARPLAIVAACLGAGLLLAGEGPDLALRPRPYSPAARDAPLSAVVRELSAQTGNALADRRTRPADPRVKFSAGPITFWPALDLIGRQTGVGFSAFGEDGGVALVDAPYRPAQTAYAGLFRVAFRRVSVARDAEAQSHTCTLALDVAWEPRFQPFLLELKKASVAFAPDARRQPRVEQVVGQGAVPVAGRSATEVELRVPAPDRSSPAVELLEGTLTAVGPTKMLDFAFKDLTGLANKPRAPLEAEQEGVKLRVRSAKFSGGLLAVELEIENPKGGPGFESFQSWLDNNRLTLVDPRDARRVLAPESSEVPLLTASKARVVYHFAAAEGKPLPPRTLEGWELRYRTPGRIVELRETFRLTDLVLP